MKTKSCPVDPGRESYVRFLKLVEVLRLVALSKAELYRRLAAGTFPQAIRLGERSIAFSSAEVEAWQEARIAERDAKAAA